MRPSSCDSVTAALGHSACRIAAARVSHSALRGENTEAIATEAVPAARIRRAASRMPVSSNGTIGRPSYSCPPSSMTTSPRTSAARSSGQSTKGGSDALAGRPIRTAATRVRSRRWTTAFVKCVVPIMTASIGPLVPTAARSSRSAVVIPPVTSAVVGVLTAWTTASPSSRTASVLVPPTSMPTRLTRARASREHRLELQVVAERPGPHVLEALGREQDGRRRQRHHAHALSVAERLGADRLTGDGGHDANEIGRHDPRPTVEPAHRELVLERQLEALLTMVTQPVDPRGPPQEALGRAAGHVGDLAAEQELAALGLDDRLDRVTMSATCRLDRLPQPDRLARGVEDPALLDLFARARRLAGRGDRADRHAGRTREALHPFPRRRLRDDDRVVAHVDEHERVHAEVVDGERRHLGFGERAAHGVG